MSQSVPFLCKTSQVASLITMISSSLLSHSVFGNVEETLHFPTLLQAKEWLCDTNQATEI